MIEGFRIKRRGKACLFAVLLGALFLTCSKDRSPVEPIQNERGAQSDFQVLSFGEVQPALHKSIVTTATVTRRNGGYLYVRYDVPTVKNIVKVTVSLVIPPYAITADSIVMSMQVDPAQFLSTLDVVFGPHGVDFVRPARLCVWIQNMDFTGINPSSIGIYYDDRGSWTPMPNASITANPKAGILNVINALLPHFSRYALSRGG
jgi:hypothetical protein